jgi:hypothetical protein
LSTATPSTTYETCRANSRGGIGAKHGQDSAARAGATKIVSIENAAAVAILDTVAM